MERPRARYPRDVSDAAWAFLVPYLERIREGAPPRRHSRRELFNAVRYVVKTGCPWRFRPHDVLPWPAAYQQARRWAAAGAFERAADDLRVVTRLAAGRNPHPSAAILGGRTRPSTPESGRRAGFDGHEMKDGSKVHAAVDARGNRLARTVTPADEQERAQVADLAARVQEVTGPSVQVAFVDPGYTGADAAAQAGGHGIRLEVVTRPDGAKGFVLRLRRWVVERTFGWLGRFRRLARDDERLAETLRGWHWLAFLTLRLTRVGLQSA